MLKETENRLEFAGGGDPYKEEIDENFLHHLPGGMYRIDSITPDLEPSRTIRKFIVEEGHLLKTDIEVIPEDDRAFVEKLKRSLTIAEKVDEFLNDTPEIHKAWNRFVRVFRKERLPLKTGAELARPVYVHVRRKFSRDELTYV